MLTMEQLKVGSEIGKNLISLLRDLFLFILFILLVTNIDAIVEWLRVNNVKKVDTGFATFELSEVQQKTASTVDAADRAKVSTGAALEQTQKLIQQDPALAAQLEPVVESLKKGQADAATASAGIRSVAAQQQAVLSTPLSGWVAKAFLDGDDDRFALDTLATVTGHQPLNVRAGPGLDNATRGILPPGTRVRVTAPPSGAWVQITTEKAP